MTLRILQYAYFAVYSEWVSAEEMAERIGLQPDSVFVRGSRRQSPKPIPWAHKWAVECHDRDLDIGDQAVALIQRLRPYEEAIATLVEDLYREETSAKAGPVLTFVRHMDDRKGVADGWQHRLLGWHLPAEVVSFLASVHAEIDADEYGQDLPWWRFRLRRRYERVEEGSVIIDAETGVQVAGPYDPTI